MQEGHRAIIASSEILLTPFVGLVCTGDHPHAVLMGGQAHKAQRWSKDMCDRIAFGIQQLARKVLSKPKTILAHPSVAAGSDDPAPPEPNEEEEEEPWRKCKGCRWRLPKNDAAHSRVRGECKHPDVPSVTFDCPGCAAKRPCDNQAHTYGPNRHAVTTGRKKAPKRPRSQVPAAAEPTTSSLRARGMGDADEQEAESRLEAEGAASPAEPGEPSGAHPANEIAAGAPTDEAAAGDLQMVHADGAAGERVPADRQGRGPDVVARVRRTYREGEVQTPDPSDWRTSFDISASLRGLCLSDEAGQRRILRKLHLRWWHASSNRMIQLLKIAGIPQNVLDIVPEVVDTCRVC